MNTGWHSNTRRFRRFSLGFGVGAMLATVGASAQPTITNLGVLPGGTSSAARGVNENGTVVVGESSTNASGTSLRAFRWTAGGGMENLGVLSGHTSSTANAIGSDGLEVVGQSGAGSGARAFRWTSADGMQSLGLLPTGTYSAATGISSNGTIVGAADVSTLPAGTRAFRWTSGGGMQNLGVLPGGSFSSASAISADSATVTGSGDSNSGELVLRWTACNGMRPLDSTTDSSYSFGSALASVPGGTMTAGATDTPSGLRAATWDTTGQIRVLGVLPGGTSSAATSISDGGRAVVGNSTSLLGPQAFLWTSAMGMVNLNQYLAGLGVDMTGWNLTHANGVSADGRAIVGQGDWNGQPRAWLVSALPDPCVAPQLDAQPASVTTRPDGFAVFSVTGAGTTPFKFFWEVLPPASSDWVPVNDGPLLGGPAAVSGAGSGNGAGGNASLAVSVRHAPINGARFRVTVYSACLQPTQSDPATITVVCPADFDANGVLQPADVGAFINAWFAAVTSGC